MRFHVIGMAHTQATKEYSSCAYTQKVRNFCKMMHERGHEVFLYAGEECDVEVTEHLVCITEKERAAACKGHYLNVEHKADAPHWVTFNGRACGHLASRARKGDFLCIIFGYAQKLIHHAYPILKCVEYGVGYHHTFAEHRVFESYAWMHSIYAAEKGTDRDGVWFDDVIHGYLNPLDFPMGKPLNERKDYLLYMGRIINRKGVQIAAQVAKAAGKHLIVCGTGDDPPHGCQYLGEVGFERRAELMGNCRAVIAPTVYLEPFGNVAIEAQACGTPVITTDWGAFTETVIEGVTGFRCRVLQEFVDAVEAAAWLDHNQIRYRAIERFSIDVIGDKYERYFQRLSTLWGKGWDQLREPA